MTKTTVKSGTKAGRPKGSSDKPKVTKLKLKPSPTTAKEDFQKKYRDLTTIAVYGVDDFTEGLVKHLWKDTTKDFVVCDPVEQLSANLNRTMGNLPYSMYRYEQLSPQGFIECGYYAVVVVAEIYWEQVNKLPNPHGVELVCLSHWEK